MAAGIAQLTNPGCSVQNKVNPNRELILDDFKEARAITLSGARLKSFIAAQDCLYFEWAYGNKQGSAKDFSWTEYSVGYQSRVNVVVQTQAGEISLSERDFRLFLKPATSQTYDRRSPVSKLPEPIRAWIEQHDSATVEESLLVEGKSYYALLHIDHYSLPPEGAGPPRSRQRKVLWISDEPFVDGKATVPITPAYKGWTY